MSWGWVSLCLTVQRWRRDLRDAIGWAHCWAYVIWHSRGGER